MMRRRAPMKRIGSPMISAVIAEPVPWGACTTNHWGRLAIVAPMTHNSQPRYRKVGWIERRTKATSYRAPGTSRNDDEPIHAFVPVQSAVGGSGAGSVHVT